MSNFDNFDFNQIASKLTQRWHFICSFYCKIFFILSSLDNAENAQKTVFFWTPNIIVLHLLDTSEKPLLEIENSEACLQVVKYSVHLMLPSQPFQSWHGLGSARMWLIFVLIDGESF